MEALKWRFRNNARLVEKIVTCIALGQKSKSDLHHLFNDMHKLSVIMNRLKRYNILSYDACSRYSLTQYGRWLLICYTLGIRPVQLAILALLYNNYHRSIAGNLGWIVPVIRREVERLSVEHRVYDGEYAWKQAKALCAIGWCRRYGRDGIILEDATYEMLKQWHDDIYALYRHLRSADRYEVCV
ncbi:MAG: hypothetical protein NZ888_06530 [Candidatus Nitrosocaldus sp.]|nr:hypothetical protein [Candidatus Nitrosocaldus sp.]MDW8000529.1 hypothetical protein [Candidatus Nitrosocaldus sp.]